MLPKEYFEDPLTRGVAYGAYQHVKQNRFTLLKLPVGYGKTIISMHVARAIAQQHNNELQLMVIAPKAKRLDKSFEEAIQSVEEYYHVKLSIVPINGQETGTFAGLNTMKRLKPEMWQEFVDRLCQRPTLMILDETHMQMRNPTGQANKTFVSLFKQIDRAKSTLHILGLTATPFDTSILDTVGYLVLNGDYSSRTAFYRQEIVGYQTAFARGLNQRDVDNMIVDRSYRIHKEMFTNLQRVLKRINRIIYAPDVPVTFHIPKNEFKIVPVSLSQQGSAMIGRIEMFERQRAYDSNGAKMTDYTRAITTDANVLDKVVELVKNPDHNQPLIFYRADLTLDALRQRFDTEGIKHFEINGHNQDYFDNNDEKSPVFVQYLSGAAAFESKSSNLSIYLELPASDINFQQSLGRNARRGQQMDVITNYIIEPLQGDNRIRYFDKTYNRVVNKTHWNTLFGSTFTSKWGAFGENRIRGAIQ